MIAEAMHDTVKKMTRRNLLIATPFLLRAQRPAPAVAVASGDVTDGKALIWARSAGPASRMTVRWKTSEKGSSHSLTRAAGGAESDFTSRIALRGLPPGQTVLYTVQFEDGKNSSEPVEGKLRTPSRKIEDGRNVRFAWSGDVAGQGYGINPEWGGMRGFEAVRAIEPDFFIHSGDTIYADGPIAKEVVLPNGAGVWKNIVTPEKAKAAETLDEFRGAYRYNLLDANVRRHLADVPQIWQWDDHEVMNNWSPGMDLSGNMRYTEKDIRVIAARARQAFGEYAPIPFDRQGRIFRVVPYGPLVDVFVLDMRSFRAGNSYNRQEAAGPDTALLGNPQVDWLLKALKDSKAVWKVIASDMPIGLVVGDGKDAQGRARYEAVANGDGPVLGREFEIARILKFLKAQGIRNTVWLTADVHYTAAHRYSPERASAGFRDFDPFWEFVSGPLNAGTFGPGQLDSTFGPEVMFAKHPPKGQSNLPPSAGYQFFGDITVDGRSKALRVVLRDIAGTALFTKELEATAR
ncbi:MAG: alkaline phosphatase D family protein [Acidobacteria bacterium]|nr:alkaline phosphatase D family protein [Acidobacteriota bacterium]